MDIKENKLKEVEVLKDVVCFISTFSSSLSPSCRDLILLLCGE